MENLLEFLHGDGAEKFKEAKKLANIEAKNDPENDPFRSRYKERELLQEIHSTVTKKTEELGLENEKDVKIILCSLEYKLGINYLDTEETPTAEDKFTKCLDVVEEYKFEPSASALYLSVLNQLGILWANRRKPDRALSFLQQGEEHYHKYKDEKDGSPLMIEELFIKTEEEDVEKLENKRAWAFEETYTHTLYYLAQVYGSLDESRKSAEYCQMTLSRQLDTMKYDPIDWAVNAAALSQYYITQNIFPLARHCLASADFIIQEAKPPESSETSPSDTATVDEKERLPKAKADINRCWSKYALALLDVSAGKLMEEINDDEGVSENGATSNKEDEREKADANILFNLELTIHENQITDQYVKDFEEARKVFLCIQRWLNSAKEFYMLDSHCVDYVEIIQDMSKAYKLLAFYETDFDRQCKMHKRRIDMLDVVLKALNPQFYLLICRQLMYEMAETYSAMLDLKYAIIEETGNPPSSHAVKKINTLAEQSIMQYKDYINSLKDSNQKMPKKLSDEDERPALVAHFCIGRLYSKFLEFDPQKKIALIQKSIDYYKFLVDYCKDNPSSESKVKEEFRICEEMVALLPTKMERLRLQME